MILIDLSRTLIASIIQQSKRGKIEGDLARHFVLNSIQSINSRFRAEYGQLVLAVDDRTYWRKDIFPYYKAGRSEGRAKSPIDWDMLFSVSNDIKKELKETFPYTFVQSEKAEADDVIGTICHHYGVDFGPADEDILIVASDNDFNQLLKYSNVKQWEPANKRFLPYDVTGLEYKIIKGDTGDGIPNIKSDDDAIVNPDKKQARMTKNAIKDVLENKENYIRNWKRNQELIDLSFTPDYIKKDIINKVEAGPAIKDRSKLMGYFAEHKLRTLYDKVDHF